ncbi:MAG: sensor domain-containing diguanylate cyclase [Steroidobacteraceae bacterium]
MNWTTNTMRFARHTSMRHSIALRSASIVIMFTFGVGLLFALVSVPLMQRHESGRLEAMVSELAATVEPTVSIACFVGDKALAAEVARGLLKNHAIASVRIVAGANVLADLHGEGRVASDTAVASIQRSIASPFNAEEIVGELTLVPDVREIRAQAGSYARYLGVILVLQAIALAAVVVYVGLKVVVGPIKKISDELHLLEVENGKHLAMPVGNERNEFGRLTLDVNALIDRLSALLGSERKQRQEREHSERRLRLIFDNTESGMFVVDAAFRLLDWNAALARELGLSAERGVERSVPRLDLLLAPHGERVRALVERTRFDARAIAEDFEIHIPGQRAAKWLNLLLQAIEPDRLHGMIQDVTARKLTEAAALALAAKDALTGLLNRRGMELVIDRQLQAAKAGELPSITLMMLDLDWFKQVNDTHGHEGGDEVLQVVARRLQSAVRPADIVARWGGDEFVLLLNETTDAASASILATRLIERLSEPITLANGAVARIGASIGLATFGGEIDSRESLLHAADGAMYGAKQHGRSRVGWSSPLSAGGRAAG